MTVIIRHENNIYFDTLLLINNQVGGTFDHAKSPKVYKHPNFNAIIGVSGSFDGHIFPLVKSTIDQWLIELSKDIHAPIALGDLTNYDSTTPVTVGVFCKDINLILNHDGNGSKQGWTIFKIPPHRTTGIGNCLQVWHLKDEFDKAIKKNELEAIRLVVSREVFASCDWFKLDINDLGEL